MSEVAVLLEEPRKKPLDFLKKFRRPGSEHPNSTDTEVLPVSGPDRDRLLAEIESSLSAAPDAFDISKYNTAMFNLIGGKMNERTHKSNQGTQRLTQLDSEFRCPDGRQLQFYSQTGGNYGRTDKINVVTGETVEKFGRGLYQKYSTSPMDAAGIYGEAVATAVKVAGRDAGQIAHGEPYLQTLSDTQGNSYQTRNKLLTPPEVQEFCKRVFRTYTDASTPSLPDAAPSQIPSTGS